MCKYLCSYEQKKINKHKTKQIRKYIIMNMSSLKTEENPEIHFKEIHLNLLNIMT